MHDDVDHQHHELWGALVHREGVPVIALRHGCRFDEVALRPSEVSGVMTGRLVGEPIAHVTHAAGGSNGSRPQSGAFVSEPGRRRQSQWTPRRAYAILARQLEGQNRNPRYVRQALEAVRKFERWAAREDQILCLVLSDVTSDRLHRFLLSLRSQRLAQATLDGIRGRLFAVLKAAKSRGLLAELPDCPAVKAYERAGESDDVFGVANVHVPRRHVDALYQACRVATWPARSSGGAAAQWRAFLVMLWHYGPRPGDLVKTRPEHDPLVWARVTFAASSPHPRSRAKSEFGWWFYVPHKTREKKPQALVLPLTNDVRAHLDAIRPPFAAPTDRVFPWREAAKKQFYAQWHAICQAAGVAQPGGEAYTPYHLRKTCSNLYQPEELAKKIIGWAPRGVAGVHYRNDERRIVRAVMALRPPQSFVSSE